jgi:hypothetical protein
VRNMSALVIFRGAAFQQRNSLGRVHFGGSGLCGRCRDGRLAKGVVEVRVTVDRALAILNFETHTISSSGKSARTPRKARLAQAAYSGIKVTCADRSKDLAFPGWRALAWFEGRGVRFFGDVGD